MPDIVTRPKTKVRTKVERPRLHKVILVNDDFTPREFVVMVLKAEFRMTEDQAHKVMITAHQRGTCVVAVFTKDVAETKATRATDAGRAKGYPLLFTTEPSEDSGTVGKWLDEPMFFSQFDQATTRRIVEGVGFELLGQEVEAQLEGDQEIAYVWFLARKGS